MAIRELNTMAWMCKWLSTNRRPPPSHRASRTLRRAHDQPLRELYVDLEGCSRGPKMDWILLQCRLSPMIAMVPAPNILRNHFERQMLRDGCKHMDRNCRNHYKLARLPSQLRRYQHLSHTNPHIVELDRTMRMHRDHMWLCFLSPEIELKIKLNSK